MTLDGSMSTGSAFWKEKLATATLTGVPTDFVRPVPPAIVEATTQFKVPESVARLAATVKQTPHTTLLAVLSVLVARLSGDEDIVIGADIDAGSVVALRTQISPPSTTFDVVISSIADELRASSTYALSSAAQYASVVQSTDPIWRVAVYHTPEAPRVPVLESGTDIAFFINNDKSLVDFDIHYNSLLFNRDRIVFLLDQIGTFSERVSSRTAEPVGSISLVSASQCKILPDPTTDLHWSDFRGPIHDIFAANAAAHPDRMCVLETACATDPERLNERSFSYRQIDEASNVLAHQLIQSGVQVGDVVSVYAHRGVDLVVAVFGVLKAGAAFSVIDIAYPPARQIIYLQVAQPTALVVLKRAGQLDSSVQEYIDNNLKLRTFIPALQLADDGSLSGSLQSEISANIPDILACVQHKARVPTGVVVGPDSTPTLSFTSGSEGVPKGVRGRHFSLTYYFPWMAKTYGLSSNDRFTMLSGIAHDPIQRDMFTPLFLGASLIVPAPDDIGTPGQLATWMAKNGATVTHLTPAMGQLLAAEATTPIPTLHHAFFVGDILTKRDCRRLQALARNVSIVNMYGTTETQRAVSFYLIPSVSEDPAFLSTQKDVIPAGKGMVDVQLIVVNRTDRSLTCAIGEIGEIYVRAGGLAECYLGLPELSAQKFVKSWFKTTPWPDLIPASSPWRAAWLGPRDRLYRTGDLGRYTPDGNVECSGRADDQVKIRGFRIELGEIDTHLSQHTAVRENITLVRRDKDEEPTLVSYFVPHETVNASTTEASDPIVSGLVRYADLIRDIRAYLKTKLPSYAVPTVIVPLAKLPLNPNGKIDKPRLPFPDTAQLAAAASVNGNSSNVEGNAPTLTVTEASVRDLWLEVLPHQPAVINPSDSFFDVGGHSMLATRMIFELRKRLAVELPLGYVYAHPTLAALASEIDRIKNSDMPVSGLVTESSEGKNEAVDYAADAAALVKKRLPAKFASAVTPFTREQGTSLTVFVTGATGFLGSYLVQDLLAAHGKSTNIQLILHVRAKTPEAGMERVQASAKAYGVWEDSFASHIRVVTGSLEQDNLGLSQEEWSELADTVDVIIHNGAQVHWVYPYTILRGPNVIGTLSALELAAKGKPKSFVFVSSTSTLDNDYFVDLSDAELASGRAGVSEEDDLSGSSSGLGNGYGQSKWAAEYIVRAAGARGLTGAVIRPGYVTGQSVNGITNTDDFIVRMMKGCVQLGLVPDIHNTVNMVPVDHVARVIIASAFSSPSLSPGGVRVVHVTGHPRLRFNEFLGTLADYGYDIASVNYVHWRQALETYVVRDAKDNALYPLLHFVLDNLPSSTRAPELDDKNAIAALEFDASTWTSPEVTKVKGAGVSKQTIGIYLAYLVSIGFIDRPTLSSTSSPLPSIAVPQSVKESLAAVGGRGRM
ncbi:hypothetical protein V1511DRAFT_496690 [Dipodascopsis uninucleata]